MDTLQVLVATMHQKDFSIGEKMNIRCGAVFANQADRNETAISTTQWGHWKMVTTATRGVGLNRNFALLSADAEILMLADDDVVYNDDMPQQVAKAFQENPQADVLIFGMDIVKNGKVTEKRHLQAKRRHVWDSMRFGTYTMAIRRKALLRGNITFHQCFGGGCMYSAGEDSIFLKTCFDRGLKIYSHPYVLGTCCKDTSSWFVGHNEKYFYDKGALMAHLFPRIPHLMGIYFGVRFKRETNVPVMRRVQLIFRGIRGGKKLEPYTE